MGVTIAVMQASVSGTGVKTYTTTDLGGLTPKAALFILPRASTNGTAETNLRLGIGATDGTNQWAATWYCQDAQATSSTSRQTMTDKCISLKPTTEGQAAFDSWVTNGVKLNWTDAPEAMLLMMIVFFAGTDTSVDVGTFIANATQDASTDVTAPGFEPDAVLFATAGDTFGDSSANHAICTIGAAVNDGSDTQRALFFEDENNLGTTELQADLSTGYATGQLHNGSLTWAGEIGTFDASGFTCTTRLGGSDGDVVGYLALAFGGVKSTYLATVSTPTSTGNASVTGAGMTPDVVLQALSLLTATDSVVTTGDAGSIGIGAFTSSAEYAAAASSEDGVGTSNTQTLTDNKAVTIPQDGGTAGLAATYVSMDSDGWTLNYSAVLGSARQFWVLAIGTATAVSGAGARMQMINPAVMTFGPGQAGSNYG